MRDLTDESPPAPAAKGGGVAVSLDDALAHRALPLGDRVMSDRPFRLPCRFWHPTPRLVTPDAFDAELARRHGDALARRAEARAPEAISCRTWRPQVAAAVLAGMAGALATALVLAFGPTVRALMVAAFAAVAANLALRTMALLALLRARGAPPTAPLPPDPPVITLLVPVADEAAIVPDLLRRLARLDYPPDRLDVIVLAEAWDTSTVAALRAADPPLPFRCLVVPDGHPRTKPRAMNYALPFARGEIVGVYDAEDAPAPDQLRRVAARMAAAPPEVACLQGLLDYYNAGRNWMSRCFAIEYAGWFRLVLPGLARLGLVIPLGGTTLFFRRAALEAVGGWDAHNVTEDAELGVRLARAGYRTEVIETVTLEEANAAPGPWVRQRSRWMKGYVMTWAMHARRPVALWRDLGTKRFLGMHLLFLGAVANALLMPVLWTLAVIPFGLPHPARAWLPPEADAWLAAVPMGLTLCVMGLSLYALRAPEHRSLRWWVALTEPYFALASVAVVKAMWELVAAPFHWDKTAHGRFGGVTDEEARPATPPRRTEA
ncbi:glycosyltransferase [Jannaschia sp. Os4]|uniref:glycosyltransferase n=1 Tax=Jannaschia sp. Os4 TaxID=2807617 RepID=UPI00193A033F|nr:glycosyltransferase [Jannaschia sp. Os4]MBM2577558.1 glycosyltransferase [Jannaschia sp. Os4]